MILACGYDIYVSLTGHDPILPDSRFYSVRGRYVDIFLQGYREREFLREHIPTNPVEEEIFVDTVHKYDGKLPARTNDMIMHFFVVGIIYHVLGYHTIWVRLYMITISMLSVLLMSDISRRIFGRAASTLLLVTGLLIPTQFLYSITLSRDFLRVVFMSVVLWSVYFIGDLCLKRLRSVFCSS